MPAPLTGSRYKSIAQVEDAHGAQHTSGTTLGTASFNNIPDLTSKDKKKEFPHSAETLMRRIELLSGSRRGLSPGAASLSRYGYALCYAGSFLHPPPRTELSGYAGSCKNTVTQRMKRCKKKNPKMVPSLRHPCAFRGKHFRGPTSWRGRQAKKPVPPLWYQLITE